MCRLPPVQEPRPREAGAEGTGKRIVPTGVQNDNVEAGIGAAHGIEEIIDVNRPRIALLPRL